MTNVYERGVTGTMALASPAPQQQINQGAIGTSRAAMLRSPDSIRRLSPQSMPHRANYQFPGGGGVGTGGGMNTIIQQLLNIIQQLLSALGLGG